MYRWLFHHFFSTHMGKKKGILLGRGICKQMESRRTLSNYILIASSFLFLKMRTQHRYGGKDCLTGALPSSTMLTLRWLSTRATNEMNPGALAHTAVPLFAKHGLCINQTGSKHQSWCPRKRKKSFILLKRKCLATGSRLFQLLSLCVDFVKTDLFFFF